MTKTNKIIMVVLIIICVFLLARFVIFKDSFDRFGQNLENIGEWETNYKNEHPNGTKAERDAAFDKSMAGLKVWEENYKSENPDATKTEIDSAFNAQWK